MQAPPADRAWTRPWVRLGFGVAALAGSVAIAIGAPDGLPIGSLRLAEPADRAAPENAELLVALRSGPDEPVGSRIFEAGRAAVSAQMAADPAIADVRELERRRGVLLVAEFADVSQGERQDAAIRIAEEIDPGALDAQVGGEVDRLLDARRQLSEDLLRAGVLVLPLALLLAAMAIGWRSAAPALCAGIAIAGSLALLRLTGLVADVSLLGFAPAAAVGLVLGVELPLAASRRAGRRPTDLGRRTLTVAAVASLPGVAGLATPLDQAASLALGAAFAALLAAAAALLVAPAVDELTSDGETLPPRPPTISRRDATAGLALGVIGLAVLAVPAVLHGATASYVALDTPSFLEVPDLDRSAADSLFGELPLVAALAAAGLALALAALARRAWALALGPVSLLPAAAAAGVCAFVTQHHAADLIGRSDPDGAFMDTATLAIAVSALAAIGAARSAALALDLRARRRPALGPAAGASFAGVLAAGPMVPVASELGLALGAGVALDFLFLRIGLWAVANRWIGSADE